MEMTSAPEDALQRLLDRNRIGRLQIVTVVLCSIVAMIDGFDTQSIAFVAPVMAKAWHLDLAAFGPVFGIGLLGLALGAFLLGPLADRFGRKPVIIVSTIVIGLGAAASAWTNGLTGLIACRLLTGFGLGGAIPNIISLTAEYSPKRTRALVVTAMFCGFPIGAVIGGLISARLIPAFGWQSVFLAGGLLPLALAPILLVFLPESIRFLVATGRTVEAARLGARIAPGEVLALDSARPRDAKRAGLRDVFAQGRATGTLLIWCAFFCNLLTLYFLINWLPSVLQSAGMALDTAIVSTVLLNAGGVIGGLSFSRMIDRFGPRVVLSTAYLVASLCVAAIGAGWTSSTAVLAIVFLSGVCVVGAQFGMNALVADYYPTPVRASGVGAAFGIGRVGSVIGPILGGLLLARELPLPALFAAAAVPMLCAAVAIFFACASAKPKARGAALDRSIATS